MAQRIHLQAMHLAKTAKPDEKKSFSRARGVAAGDAALVLGPDRVEGVADEEQDARRRRLGHVLGRVQVGLDGDDGARVDALRGHEAHEVDVVVDGPRVDAAPVLEEHARPGVAAAREGREDRGL